MQVVLNLPDINIKIEELKLLLAIKLLEEGIIEDYIFDTSVLGALRLKEKGFYVSDKIIEGLKKSP